MINNNDSKWIIGFIIGLFIPLIVVLIIVPILSGASIEGGRWVKESLDKKINISQKKEGKLIILAGSNALFGYSAKYIEEKYGIPAVNMAIHAGLGLSYILHYGEISVKPNDLVVLPLEYELYGPEKSEYAKVYQVIAYDQDFFSKLSFIDKINFLSGINYLDWVRLIKAKIKSDKPTTQLYNSKNLNNWGDETSNTIENFNQKIGEDILRLKPQAFILDPDALKKIKEFKDYVESKGGTVIIVYPNIIRNALDLDLNKKFFENLKVNLAKMNIPIIGSPEDFFFDKEDLFDSRYHQNIKGQLYSTDRLMHKLIQTGILNSSKLTLNK